MTTHWLWSALSLGLALAWPLQAAEQTATVSGNRVNVRGKASLNGEVITQLSEGDTVVVLEKIPVSGAKAGEPGAWAKIRLPKSTSVFVYAPYIEEGTHKVKVSRLNMRGGPGENYSVLGRIERGAEVKEIQTTASWMEIEAPAEAYAFVAMDFVKVSEAAVVEAQPEEAVVSEPVEVVQVEEAPGIVSEPVSAEAWPEGEEPGEVAAAEGADVAATVPMVPTLAEESPMLPRMVYREGRVVESMSIQAPSRWSLMSLETKQTINFLHTEKEGLSLKAFAGKDVLLKGEELLDARWKTPLLEVEDIRLAPR
ncbi:MAG: SH3 domain-containing protein [Limisphaerales bacterium]|jgi:hypothetical protein